MSELDASSRHLSFDDRTSTTCTLSARPSSMQVDMLYGHTVSPIIDGWLYLSDHQAPVDSNLLNFLGVTHIVNASNEAVPNKFPESYHYYNVNIEDDNSEDILPHFNDVCDFLADKVAQPTTSKTREEIVNDLSHSAETMIDSILRTTVEKIETTLNSPAKNDQTSNPLLSNSKLDNSAGGSSTDIAMGAQTMNMQELEQAGKVILFHCRMGISRSATLMIAYLIRSMNMTLKEAYGLVKRRRPKISPTPVFADALVKYETMMHPQAPSSMTIFQLSGATAMRIAPPSNPNGTKGDDDISVASASTHGSKSPSSLSPMSDPQNSMKDSKTNGNSCACCIVM